MKTDQKPAIVNLEDLEYRELSHGQSFAALHGLISRRIRAEKLGYRMTVVPPGKTAFPHHCHLVNEEMLFILEGEGRLRLGDEEHAVRGGDFIALAAGPDGAHQLLNTGDADLKYLAVSTMEDPDIVRYPDSGKLGVFAGSAPGGRRDERVIASVFKEASCIDYWDGED